MTKCAMTNKEIRCPECGGKDVALHYDVNYTHIYCQNMKRDYENQCKSIGRYCFLTYSHYDPKYPEIIRKDMWIEAGYSEESIEFSEEKHKLKIAEQIKELELYKEIRKRREKLLKDLDIWEANKKKEVKKHD